MKSFPKKFKSKVGRGEWRITTDTDTGEIVAIELWDSAGGTPISYECLRITH